MHLVRGVLPLTVLIALPVGAQVSVAPSPRLAGDTLTVTVSPAPAAGMVRFYIERTAGHVAVVAPDIPLPGASRSVRGLLQARGPVRLLVEPGAVGLRLRAVEAGEALRVEHQSRDSGGTIFLTAEGPSITFVRRGGEPELRVLADRTQRRRVP